MLFNLFLDFVVYHKIFASIKMD